MKLPNIFNYNIWKWVKLLISSITCRSQIYILYTYGNRPLLHRICMSVETSHMYQISSVFSLCIIFNYLSENSKCVSIINLTEPDYKWKFWKERQDSNNNLHKYKNVSLTEIRKEFNSFLNLNDRNFISVRQIKAFLN